MFLYARDWGNRACSVIVKLHFLETLKKWGATTDKEIFIEVEGYLETDKEWRPLEKNQSISHNEVWKYQLFIKLLSLSEEDERFLNYYYTNLIKWIYYSRSLIVVYIQWIKAVLRY